MTSSNLPKPVPSLTVQQRAARQVRAARLAQAATSDDLLTVLATIEPDQRPAALAGCSLKILRATADLCGEDAEAMTKRQAIAAIVENF